MDVPFNQIKFTSLNYTQLNNYQTAWNTFNQIEQQNSNVSTLRGNGIQIDYPPFDSALQEIQYKQGFILHVAYLSTLVQVVQKI
jgi:hypothetical protein